jgi:hypothetical protein
LATEFCSKSAFAVVGFCGCGFVRNGGNVCNRNRSIRKNSLRKSRGRVEKGVAFELCHNCATSCGTILSFLKKFPIHFKKYFLFLYLNLCRKNAAEGIYFFEGVYLRYVFDSLKLRNFQVFVKNLAAINAVGSLYRYATIFVCLYNTYGVRVRCSFLRIRVMRRPQRVERAE